MFEINTESVRREYHIYSDGADDINRYRSEVLDVCNEVSSLSSMEDICGALEHIASDLSRENISMAAIAEAILRITGKFDDTEEEIISDIEKLRFIDFTGNTAIGYFDTGLPPNIRKSIDTSVMDELTALIS